MGYRKNRSDSYQHLLLERVCSHDMLEAFSNDDSIYKKLNPFAYNEEIEELKDKLKEEVWRLIFANLTSRQAEILELYAKGWTQSEIAKKLGINQSSITKAINGNVDYKNGKKIYGGSKKKIMKLIETDVKIQEIFNRIKEIREDEW